MESIAVQKILTHEHPDLDAMMSVLLLKKFGEAQFPGVENAEVIFSPAGTLPEGKSPRQLEKQGIIAVDIGGGRFDSHPSHTTGQAKADRSATDLVAETLGVLDHPDWKALIEFSRLHDTTGHSMYSTNILHHISALSNLLKGIQIQHAGDSAAIMKAGLNLVANIPFSVKHQDDPFRVSILQEAVDNYLAKVGINMEEPPEWLGNFKDWHWRLHNKFRTTYGKNPMDKLVSLKSICHGAFYRFEEDMEQFQQIVDLCVSSMLIREKKWHEALTFYDENCQVEHVGNLTFSTISSSNGMVIKAARFRHKPDILIYQNPENGGVTLFIQRKGALGRFPFEVIAARVRVAEAVLNAEEPKFEELEALGTIHGWFLHQSYNLLIRGSNKQNKFVPTSIPLEQISQLVYSTFDKNLELQSLPKAITEAIWKYKNPLFR